MQNFFDQRNPTFRDAELLQEALSGSKNALEVLLKRHYPYIYNIVLRFVLKPEDAEDLTQEVCIKVITKLAQFNQKSDFRTWLYRIVFNHFLNSKRKKAEEIITSFEEYGKGLEDTPLDELTEQESMEYKEKIEDYKIECMTGMLLCLNRVQRLVYILGEIFEVDSRTGAELLEISSDNFRKILSRARRDLYNFMNSKCGLLHPENPCRCPNKTKEQILAGRINPDSIRFYTGFVKKISAIASVSVNKSENLLEEKYAQLFKEHPFYSKDKSGDILSGLMEDDDFKTIFDLS